MQPTNGGNGGIGPVTLAEVYRYTQALERRLEASLRAQDDRMAQMMRLDVANQIHLGQENRITALEDAIASQTEHAWSTRQALVVAAVSSFLAGGVGTLVGYAVH